MKVICAAWAVTAFLAMAHAAHADTSSDENTVTDVADETPAAILAQVACIEDRESHGENVWRGHRAPPAGQDAPAGVLQYFESTFRPHAAEMDHPEYSRWEPWQARAVAAHDLMMGRRAQWSVGGCR